MAEAFSGLYEIREEVPALDNVATGGYIVHHERGRDP
jgi:hypothetical protein